MPQGTYSSNFVAGDYVTTSAGETGTVKNVSFPNGNSTPPVYTIEVPVPEVPAIPATVKEITDPLEG